MRKSIEELAKLALLDYNGNMYELLPRITKNVYKRIIPEKFLGPNAIRENHYYLFEAIMQNLNKTTIKDIDDSSETIDTMDEFSSDTELQNEAIQ